MSRESRTKLDDKRAALRQMLFDYGAVQFGEFTLASGQKSDHYIDVKKVLMVPRVIDLIGRMVYDFCHPKAIDSIGGPESAAIPIATSAILAYHKHCEWEARPHGFWVRKEKKGHGTGKLIEGRCWPDDRIVIVEDVATTGKSILHAVEAVRAAGAEVVAALVVVDRQQGAHDNLIVQGVTLHSLLTKADLGIK